jgi:radical SAM protein with 4Fe4S-binding SPASM domain
MNELILSRLIKSLNWRRFINLTKTSVSFALSALSGKNILWGRPTILTIEPTNICNLRCPLCTTGSGEMERANGKMSLATFENIMDKMGDDLFFLLLYHQGEPYINKHFLDFVKLAKAKNIYCTTSTNAHYFNDEIIRDTIDSGLDSMIVSLDGVTQQSYETYRVKGNVDKVVMGMKRFMEIKKQRKSKTPLIALQFLVMKHNEHELPAVKKLAKQIGVDRLLIKNIEVHSLEEAKQWLPVNDKFRRYNFDGQTFEVKNNDKKSCPRPWLSTLINWDGSVVPCCFDKNGEYEMGNINKAQNIQSLWFGGSFSKFRGQLSRNRKSIDMCRNCNQGFGSFIPQFKNRKTEKEPIKKNSSFPVLNQ